MPGRFMVLAFGVALAWTGLAVRLWHAAAALVLQNPACSTTPSSGTRNRPGGTSVRARDATPKASVLVLVSAYQDGAVLQVGFTILPKVGYVPMFGGGEVNPNTGTGTGGGRCFAPTLAGLRQLHFPARRLCNHGRSDGSRTDSLVEWSAWAPSRPGNEPIGARRRSWERIRVLDAGA